MTNTDLILIYKKFEEIDRQLKELHKEVATVQGYPQRAVYVEGSDYQKGPAKPFIDLQRNKPAQWPNEPYTDYLKRIGEYNEAMIYEDGSK